MTSIYSRLDKLFLVTGLTGRGRPRRRKNLAIDARLAEIPLEFVQALAGNIPDGRWVPVAVAALRKRRE